MVLQCQNNSGMNTNTALFYFLLPCAYQIIIIIIVKANKVIYGTAHAAENICTNHAPESWEQREACLQKSRVLDSMQRP